MIIKTIYIIIRTFPESFATEKSLMANNLISLKPAEY